MPTIRRLPEFAAWLDGLRDRRAAVRVETRIDRLALGNPGDSKSVGGDVHELWIDYGPGYRAYFTNRGAEVVVLLCGGDKRSQDADIAEAKRLSATVPGSSSKPTEASPQQGYRK